MEMCDGRGVFMRLAYQSRSPPQFLSREKSHMVRAIA